MNAKCMLAISKLQEKIVATIERWMKREWEQWGLLVGSIGAGGLRESGGRLV